MAFQKDRFDPECERAEERECLWQALHRETCGGQSWLWMVFQGLLSQKSLLGAATLGGLFCHSPIRKGSLPPKGQNKEDIFSICIYFVDCCSQQNCACGLPFTTGIFPAFSCRNISRADVHCMMVPKACTCLQSCERTEGKYQIPGKPPREGEPRFNLISCLKGEVRTLCP